MDNMNYFPKSLDDWNIDTIKGLLQPGHYEDEHFDFKVKLPNKNDDTGKLRLKKTISAFANSYGGYLIYGIDSDRKKKTDQRIIGIDKEEDFLERFGNFPKACAPSVQWKARNPAIQLESGNVLPIIYIPRSWNGPHAVGNHEKGWFFTKRTNKGDEGMSYEEIRLMFLNIHERRMKLNLLIEELKMIKIVADTMLNVIEDHDNDYSVLTINTSIIENLLSDVYILLSNEEELLLLLRNLRFSANALNNKIQKFLTVVGYPITNREEIIASHNKDVKFIADIIIEQIKHANLLLENFLQM